MTAATKPPTTVSATAAAKARSQLIAMARQDQATFAEFVLKDEQTGASILLAPMHEEQLALVAAHPRLVMFAHIEAGKSSLHTVGRTLFELGRDPSKRVAIVSNTQHQAAKFVGSIARYITQSSELRQVFPNLLPPSTRSRTGSQWTSESITVQRPTIPKDPSVQAIGVHGNVLGARLDLVIMDDVLDFENTRTGEQRRQLIEWVYSTLLGRLTHHGRVVVLGVAHHPGDLMHHLASTRWWHSKHFAVEDEGRQPRWPARWPTQRIADKRQELGPLEAARQLDCMARSDETSTFQVESVVAACERGHQRPLVSHIHSVPPPAFVTIGVDLAVSSRRTADLTSLSTVLVHGNGHRELIGIESGRWDAPTIIRRIMGANEAYRPMIIVVESVAAQMYVTQLTARVVRDPRAQFHHRPQYDEFGVAGPRALDRAVERQVDAPRAGVARGQRARPRDPLLRSAFALRRSFGELAARAVGRRAVEPPRRDAPRARHQPEVKLVITGR